MPDPVWKSLDSAPRKADDGSPVAVILFLPSAWRKMDRNGRPEAIAHVRQVGWWDETQQSWVASLHPNEPAQKVYPSLWAELPAEPELPA